MTQHFFSVLTKQHWLHWTALLCLTVSLFSVYTDAQSVINFQLNSFFCVIYTPLQSNLQIIVIHINLKTWFLTELFVFVSFHWAHKCPRHVDKFIHTTILWLLWYKWHFQTDHMTYTVITIHFDFPMLLTYKYSLMRVFF